MEEQLLQQDGRCFDKFCIIRHCDPHAGFSFLITLALNGVRKALENNWLPVVNYDQQGNDHFYEADRGPNSWEYYFEPVMGVSYAEVERLLAEGKLSASQISSFRCEQIWHWHKFDPEWLGTFWNQQAPTDPVAWMADKRRLGREYVRRFVRVKAHIVQQVDDFMRRHLSNHFVLGVHIRGTDFAYAEPTEPADYFRAIEACVREKQLEDFRVFLATDQSQFVDLFASKYGERLVTSAAIRSSSDVPVFLLQGVSPYQKGEDVLLDILLLSRCHFLLKCASAVGEYALWFNPEMEFVDFATSSRFDATHAVPAYLKLNAGQLGPRRRRLLMAYFRFRRFVLFQIMQWGRTVLPKSFREWLWSHIGRRIYFATLGDAGEAKQKP